MKRPFFVAAVMSIAAVYLSLYVKSYIVIIVGIMVFTGFLIYLKKTGIPGFYVIFIMQVWKSYAIRGNCQTKHILLM